MQVIEALAWPVASQSGDRHSRLIKVLPALAAMAAIVAAAAMPDPGNLNEASSEDAEAQARAALAERVRYKGGETLIAAYTGSPYTYASDLRIEGPGRDMTVHGIDWEGKAFDDPIYYGVRVARWLTGSRLGGMVDFTHSKAYAPLEQEVDVSGTRDGASLPSRSKVGDLFHKLEFTHGHNMLTFNVLWRLPSLGSFVSPYVGFGVGAALPHTEVQLKGVRGRTYEYQYVGPAAQLLIGVEVRVPRLSYIAEYKFTAASYAAPLQNRDGSWLPLDLLNQFQRWWRAEPPIGGWASTTLVSHQVIGGMGFRTVPAAVP
jgi:lipid A oxidase